MKRKTKILFSTILCSVLFSGLVITSRTNSGSNEVKAAAGNVLSTCKPNAESLGIRHSNNGWIISSAVGGAMGADNEEIHNSIVPTEDDLPVIRAINKEVTTTTTGYYYYYMTTPVSNDGALELYATGFSGNPDALGYVVMGDELADIATKDYEIVPLSDSKGVAGQSMNIKGTVKILEG